jgi:hypothetical protein
MNQSKQLYTPPKLEKHQFNLVVGTSLPVQTSRLLEPLETLLEASEEK